MSVRIHRLLHYGVDCCDTSRTLLLLRLMVSSVEKYTVKFHITLPPKIKKSVCIRPADSTVIQLSL